MVVLRGLVKQIKRRVVMLIKLAMFKFPLSPRPVDPLPSSLSLHVRPGSKLIVTMVMERWKEEVKHVLIVNIVEKNCWEPARVVDKGKFEKCTKYETLVKNS